ncbi:hypothetical protein BGX29_008215 [Mortierella sp. GBA35]|nr:hypothetical protein BGX29_008215 [Mortierella sp. GBA35]
MQHQQKRINRQQQHQQQYHRRDAAPPEPVTTKPVEMPVEMPVEEGLAPLSSRVQGEGWRGLLRAQDVDPPERAFVQPGGEGAEGGQWSWRAKDASQHHWLQGQLHLPRKENIVLEVAKEDLESVMQTGELDGNWPRVQAIAKGAAEGLAHLHSFDKVHGDLKANNILLSAEGVAMLTDLGKS